MATISEEKWIDILEKLSDGTFAIKYPKVKSQSGVTFDEHESEELNVHGGLTKVVTGSYTGNGSGSRIISLGFQPKFIYIRDEEKWNATARAWLSMDTTFGHSTYIKSGSYPVNGSNSNMAGIFPGGIRVSDDPEDLAASSNELGTIYYYVAIS